MPFFWTLLIQSACSVPIICFSISSHLDLENSVGAEVVMNFVVYCVVWEQVATTNKMATAEQIMRIQPFRVVPFNDDKVAHGLHLDFTWLELLHIHIHLECIIVALYF